MFRSLFSLVLLFLQLSALAAPARFIVMGKNSFDPIGLDVQAQILRQLPADLRVLYFYDAHDEEVITAFRAFLPTGPDAPKIKFFPVATGLIWTRDATPEIVQRKNGEWKLVSFAEKTETWNAPFSEVVTPLIEQELGLKAEKSFLHLQGGNILIDDERTLFATDLVFDDNPRYTRDQIIAELKRALEVKRVVVLPKLPGELTGHIDTFVFYGGGKKAIVARSEYPEQQEVLEKVAQVFRKEGYSVDRLRITQSEEETATQSYTNALKLEDRIFVPSYGHLRNDAAAVRVFKKLGLPVLPVNCAELSAYGGEIHCITKEYPSCVETFSPPGVVH